jgi:hypothetical protein
MVPPPDNIAIELERLRGTCAEGFARINGQLDVLVERSDRTEQDIEKLQVKVATLERFQWVAVGAATILGTGAGIISNILSNSGK